MSDDRTASEGDELYDYDLHVKAKQDRTGTTIILEGEFDMTGTDRFGVLAGADGNPRAHIFCRRVEAELIAIDGYYRMADEMAPLLGVFQRSARGEPEIDHPPRSRPDIHRFVWPHGLAPCPCRGR